MRHLRTICAVVSLSLIAGCSANWKTSYRKKPVKAQAEVITVDAKQRGILTTLMPESVDADGEPTGSAVRRFCSEPSPDVFSVIAQSLSGGASFGRSGDPKAIEAALQAAFTSSEQGSTIPRTQTINMLRELMFRTCERFLSGAYDDMEMSIQALRDQRLMVSILAIEQLTGAVAPKPVSLGAAGSASAGLGEAAIVKLDDALKAKEAAESSKDKAQKSFDELNTGDPGACDAIETAVKEDKDLTDDQKKLEPKCTAARSTLASAKEFAQTKSSHYAALKKMADTGGVTATTTTTSSAAGGIDRAHNVSVEKVSDVVKEIVDNSFNDNTEMMIFCVKALSQAAQDAGPYKSLGPTCETLFENMTRLEAAKFESQALALVEETELSRQRMKAVDDDLFESVWPKLSPVLNDNSKRKDFIKGLKDNIFSPFHSKADCFNTSLTKDKARACFQALPSALKRNLPGVN